MQQSLVRRFVISIALGVMLTACTGAPGPEDANHALAPFKANLERILAEGRTTLADLASLPEALGDDAAACSRVMLSKYNSNPEFTAFGAAHPDGTVFCLTTTQATPVNIADRSYFQRAVQSS